MKAMKPYNAMAVLKSLFKELLQSKGLMASPS